MAVVAGTIGINQFTDFELTLAHYAPVIESMKRPGVDFHAYKELGFEFPEEDLLAQQQFADHATAVLVRSTYFSYVGSNFIFTRGGTTYGVYKILRVMHISPPKRLGKFVGDPGGNTSGYMVRVVFRVQRQS